MVLAKKYGLLSCVLCCYLQVFAQMEQGQYAPDYDTNYVTDYRHRLNLSVVAEVKRNTINALTTSNKIINYQTNLPIPSYGIMFSYRWLNALLVIPVPGLSYTPPNKVDTKSYAFGLGFVARKWYFKNFLEYFRGYYMSNPEVVFPEYLNIPNAIKPYDDMKSTTYYFTAYYGLNGQKYSHRALLWQSESQKKSAGSFIMGVSGGYKWIGSDEAIFSSEEINAPVNAVQYYVAGFNFGYTYTQRLSKFFNVSVMLVPGANYFFGRYSSNESPSVVVENGFGLNAEGRLQLVFEKGDYYGGLSYTGYFLTNLLTKETPVGSTHNYLKLNFGYRFKIKPIKFLKPLRLSN